MMMGGNGKGKGKAYGKRKGPQQNPMQNLAFLQTQYTGCVDILYENLLNLNVPEGQLGPAINKVMAMRANMINICTGGAPQQSPRGGGMKPPGGKGGAPQSNAMAQLAADSDFKQVLQIAMQRKFKAEMTKEMAPNYSTQENMGEFDCTVTSSAMSGAHQGTGADKKAAERAAAKVALDAEFPEALAGVSMKSIRVSTLPTGPSVESQRVVSQTEPKGRLQMFLQAFLDRTITKEDLVYTVGQVQNPATGQMGFVASVTFPETEYAPGNVFEGQPAATEVDAKKSAAAVGVAQLEEIAGPIVEYKKQRSIEKRKMLDVQKAEEKRQKLAEDAPAGVGTS